MNAAPINPVQVNPASQRVWSDEQVHILERFRNGTTNLVVEAYAGTGKTTVIVAGVEVMPETNVLMVAFSKAIERELSARIVHLAGKAVAKTFHSIGLAIVKRFWPDVTVDFGSDRETILAQRVCGSLAPDAIKKLVGKLCTKGRLIAPYARAMGDLTDLAIRFECEPDDSWTADGFDLDYVEAKALDAMELAATEKPRAIDGADMLFLPVRNRWLRKTYGAVVVDETQDMNFTQIEIAKGICKGRLIVVGDSNQAIFGFVGADADSMSCTRGRR